MCKPARVAHEPPRMAPALGGLRLGSVDTRESVTFIFLYFNLDGERRQVGARGRAPSVGVSLVIVDFVYPEADV